MIKLPIVDTVCL